MCCGQTPSSSRHSPSKKLQQRVEHLGIVADVPQGFVLEKEPWKRYIGRRWALRRELAKSFHLTSYPIHQSIHFCVD